MSRPRRFGKSLLLSTLEAIFRGRRELFAGLWIDGSDYAWEKHPVVRVDITDLAARERRSEGELRAQIRQWYDGFCFAAGEEPVYNPFSLLLLFKQCRFANHWFESGTPTFLIDLLKKRGYDVRELEDLQVDELAFSSYEVEDLRPVPLLLQTGYLTIKGYDPESRLYTLSYPNFEVENAFLRHLLSTFSGAENGVLGGTLWQLSTALREREWERFFEFLQGFFAAIPYDIQRPQERYYQTVFYLIFKLLGLQVGVEVRTHRGWIDAVIELADGVFVFEFKVGGTAETALAQIQARGYVDPYRQRDKPIYSIGVAFGQEERGIVDWQVVETA